MVDGNKEKQGKRMNQLNKNFFTDLLPRPQMVSEATEQSRSRPLVVELLIAMLVFVIGLCLQSAVVSAIWMFMILTLGINGSFSAYIITSLFSTIVTTGVVVFYCRVIENRKLPTMGFRKQGFISEYLIGFAVGTVMFTTAIVICCFTGTLDYKGVSLTIPWPLLTFFLIGYMLQGMSEEAMCRGYLTVSIARRQSLGLAALLSSISFSALHFMNPNTSPIAFINLFMFGVFAATYFIKRGDIWGIAAIHSSWNFVQGNIFGIPVSGVDNDAAVLRFIPTLHGTLINGGDFGLEGGLAVTFVLVVATILVLMTKSRNVYAPLD